MYTSGIRCFQEWDELMPDVQYDFIGSGLFWCLEYDVLGPRVENIGVRNGIYWWQECNMVVLSVG